MCNGFYLDYCCYGDPEDPDVWAGCHLLEAADKLLRMRQMSESLYAWYQAHRDYCKSLYDGKPISVDDTCWQLDMLGLLRDVAHRMHAARILVDHRTYDDEDIPF